MIRSFEGFVGKLSGVSGGGAEIEKSKLEC